MTGYDECRFRSWEMGIGIGSALRIIGERGGDIRATSGDEGAGNCTNVDDALF